MLVVGIVVVLMAFINPSRSGAVEQQVTPRIINGSAVSAERQASMWPFLVAVASRGSDPFYAHNCGGALISPWLVLTAAHCVEDLDEKSRLVRDGAHALSIMAGIYDLNDISQGQRIPVQDVFVHPKWNAGPSTNDVAVLRLAWPAELNDYVKTTTVVQPDQDSWWGSGSGKETSNEAGPWAAGWGNMDPRQGKNNFPSELHEVLVPLASDSSCQSGKPGLGSSFRVSSMLCGGIVDDDGDISSGSTGVDTCQGDSGGPVIVGDGAGSWAVAGVVSWGFGCAESTYGAYARIASYRNWIASIPSTGGGPGGVAPVSKARVAARVPTAVMLSWKASAGAKSFVIFKEIAPGKLVRKKPYSIQRVRNERFAIITGLKRNTMHKLYIGARNAKGDMAPLRRVQFRTPRR